MTLLINLLIGAALGAAGLLLGFVAMAALDWVINKTILTAEIRDLYEVPYAELVEVANEDLLDTALYEEVEVEESYPAALAA